MGDEENGHLEPLAQVVDEVEDLGLDSHIEGCRRLVGYEQLRLTGKGDGDHDALAQAAGELVGIGGEPFGRPRHPDELQHLDRPVGRLGLGHLLVDPHRLGNLAADCHRRVQGGHRVLEDHRDVVAAHVAHLLLRHLDELFAEQGHAAADDVADVGQQLHDRQPSCALAAARFSYEAQAFAFCHGERDAVYGSYVG